MKMNQHQLETTINEELQRNSERVLNKNALSALFGAFGGPGAAVSALGKIFLGRGDALDAERHRIERRCIIELLCSIDDALKQSFAKAENQGVSLDGLIETSVKDADQVVGVDILSNQRVNFAPGTRIKTDAQNVKEAVGLRIGRQGEPK
jgi:hypothetical protein